MLMKLNGMTEPLLGPLVSYTMVTGFDPVQLEVQTGGLGAVGGKLTSVVGAIVGGVVGEGVVTGVVGG